MAPWVAANLGKQVTMIYPDYAFGYDHRDFFTAAIQEQGGEVIELLAIPPTETSFTRYLPRIPKETEVIYHVMVGPAVLTFVKELGEFYGPPATPRSSASSTASRPSTSPPPASSSSTARTSGKATPATSRRAPSEFETFYRTAVGVDDNGAATADAKEVATYAHMFSTWETLFVIKAAMEAAGYQGPENRQAVVEAIEAMTDFTASNEHPQGDKVFNGKTHQVFGHQHISKVEGGKLNVVHTTSIEDGLYPDEVDYTTMPF